MLQDPNMPGGDDDSASENGNAAPAEETPSEE